MGVLTFFLNGFSLLFELQDLKKSGRLLVID